MKGIENKQFLWPEIKFGKCLFDQNRRLKVRRLNPRPGLKTCSNGSPCKFQHHPTLFQVGTWITNMLASFEPSELFEPWFAE